MVCIYKIAFTFAGAGGFVSIGVVTFYPASGLRGQDTGAFRNTGTNGYAWSCAVTSTSGYFLRFLSTEVGPSNTTFRANGFPVRCVQHLFEFLSL